MSTTVKKQDAHRLIEQLPTDATWDDLMQEIYVHKTIESGLEDSENKNTKDVKDIRRQYGLPE